MKEKIIVLMTSIFVVGIVFFMNPLLGENSKANAETFENEILLTTEEKKDTQNDSESSEYEKVEKYWETFNTLKDNSNLRSFISQEVKKVEVFPLEKIQVMLYEEGYKDKFAWKDILFYSELIQKYPHSYQINECIREYAKEGMDRYRKQMPKDILDELKNLISQCEKNLKLWDENN